MTRDEKFLLYGGLSLITLILTGFLLAIFFRAPDYLKFIGEVQKDFLTMNHDLREAPDADAARKIQFERCRDMLERLEATSAPTDLAKEHNQLIAGLKNLLELAGVPLVPPKDPTPEAIRKFESLLENRKQIMTNGLAAIDQSFRKILKPRDQKP